VLAVGTLAIERFLPPAPLVERVGRRFAVERWDHRFELVPLPHPSGRSTWVNAPANRARLERALALLRESAGWRETFGDRARSG
jgi:uracil-DNA glycosylase